MAQRPLRIWMIVSLVGGSLSAGCPDEQVDHSKPPPLPSPPALAPQVDAPAATGGPEPEPQPDGAATAKRTPDSSRARQKPPPARTEREPNTTQARADGRQPRAAKGASLYELAKQGQATLPAARRDPRPPAPAAPKPPPAPASARPGSAADPAPPARERPAPASTVVVPSTERVRIDVPAGLQRALNADPRMQAWVNKVVAAADRCQQQNPSAVGTLKVRVTMHESARPDADILSLPAQLSPIVACATGSLMRTKMPLFTAQEGERHVVAIHFTR